MPNPFAGPRRIGGRDELRACLAGSQSWRAESRCRASTACVEVSGRNGRAQAGLNNYGLLIISDLVPHFLSKLASCQHRTVSVSDISSGWYPTPERSGGPEGQHPRLSGRVPSLAEEQINRTRSRVTEAEVGSSKASQACVGALAAGTNCWSIASIIGMAWGFAIIVKFR